MKEFTIRPYNLGDLPEIYAAANESREHIGKWMGWMTPTYSLEDARVWVKYAVDAWKTRESYEFVIVDSDDQTIVGSCGLNCINKKDLVCNLGYWIRASRLGQGAAKSATLSLREFGFEELGFNRLEIVVADGNLFSRRIAESVGAEYEGLQKMRLRNGTAVYDAHMYALLNKKSKDNTGLNEMG